MTPPGFFSSLGYAIDRTWDRKDKHVYRGRKGDKAVCIRFAKNADGDAKITNGARWNDAARTQLQTVGWTTPRLVEEGTFEGRKWVIQEWLEGEPFGDQEQLTMRSEFAEKIPDVVRLLVALDRMAKPEPLPLDDVTDPQEYLAGRIERLIAGTADIVARGVLDEAALDACIGVLRGLVGSLEFRMQHHDILPWHVIEPNHGRLGLIDAEYGGWRVRFYDAAYTLTKLLTTLKDDRLARTFLDALVESFPGAEFEPGLRFALAFTVPREMSERDAYGDEEGLRRMRRMIGAIVSGNLGDLIPSP
jgi:aminoglycoside phosphotransferase (APT) family kinase protein